MGEDIKLKYEMRGEGGVGGALFLISILTTHCIAKKNYDARYLVLIKYGE